MRNYSAYLILLFPLCNCFSQSIEVMPGTERIFIDAQWLKPFDKDYRWTLFSRSRATAEYNETQTNLFTGAYLNYTTNIGIGATVLGRIATSGSGIETGVHFFKNSKTFMIYALPTIALNSDLSYSWFSIMRYTPSLNDKLKLYTSLELFSNFNESGHVASVQRIRAGLDMNNFQFGLAVNLSGMGRNYNTTDTNPGIFIRKAFD